MLILGLEKGLEVLPVVDPHLWPIIKTCPFKMLVVDVESEGMNQIEHGVGCSAQAGYRSGVGRDLGFDENNMEG